MYIINQDFNILLKCQWKKFNIFLNLEIIWKTFYKKKKKKKKNIYQYKFNHN